MRDAKERKIYRILPCYRNDILAIEAWLEDMASAISRKYGNCTVLASIMFVLTRPMCLY